MLSIAGLVCLLRSAWPRLFRHLPEREADLDPRLDPLQRRLVFPLHGRVLRHH